MDQETAWARMRSGLEGLTEAEPARRLREFGPNAVRREENPSLAQELLTRLRSPLNLLLLVLAAVSLALGGEPFNPDRNVPGETATP